MAGGGGRVEGAEVPPARARAACALRVRGGARLLVRYPAARHGRRRLRVLRRWPRPARSSVFLVLVASFAFVTATFVVEAQATTNAIIKSRQAGTGRAFNGIPPPARRAAASTSLAPRPGHRCLFSFLFFAK